MGAPRFRHGMSSGIRVSSRSGPEYAREVELAFAAVSPQPSSSEKNSADHAPAKSRPRKQPRKRKMRMEECMTGK